MHQLKTVIGVKFTFIIYTFNEVGIEFQAYDK